MPSNGWGLLYVHLLAAPVGRPLPVGSAAMGLPRVWARMPGLAGAEGRLDQPSTGIPRLPMRRAVSVREAKECAVAASPSQA